MRSAARGVSWAPAACAATLFMILVAALGPCAPRATAATWSQPTLVSNDSLGAPLSGAVGNDGVYRTLDRSFPTLQARLTLTPPGEPSRAYLLPFAGEVAALPGGRTLVAGNQETTIVSSTGRIVRSFAPHRESTIESVGSLSDGGAVGCGWNEATAFVLGPGSDRLHFVELPPPPRGGYYYDCMASTAGNRAALAWLLDEGDGTTVVDVIRLRADGTLSSPEQVIRPRTNVENLVSVGEALNGWTAVYWGSKPLQRLLEAWKARWIAPNGDLEPVRQLGYGLHPPGLTLSVVRSTAVLTSASGTGGLVRLLDLAHDGAISHRSVVAPPSGPAVRLSVAGNGRSVVAAWSGGADGDDEYADLWSAGHWQRPTLLDTTSTCATCAPGFVTVGASMSPNGTAAVMWYARAGAQEGNLDVSFAH